MPPCVLASVAAGVHLWGPHADLTFDPVRSTRHDGGCSRATLAQVACWIYSTKWGRRSAVIRRQTAWRSSCVPCVALARCGCVRPYEASGSGGGASDRVVHVFRRPYGVDAQLGKAVKSAANRGAAAVAAKSMLSHSRTSAPRSRARAAGVQFEARDIHAVDFRLLRASAQPHGARSQLRRAAHQRRRARRAD